MSWGDRANSAYTHIHSAFDTAWPSATPKVRTSEGRSHRKLCVSSSEAQLWPSCYASSHSLLWSSPCASWHFWLHDLPLMMWFVPMHCMICGCCLCIPILLVLCCPPVTIAFGCRLWSHGWPWMLWFVPILGMTCGNCPCIPICCW